MRQILTTIVMLACIGPILTLAKSISEDSISGSALRPTDSEEIANLAGKNLVFSDFCLTTRDYVLADVSEAANQLIKSAQALSLEAYDVQVRAIGKLTEQLKNPSAAMEGLNKEDPSDAIILQGLEKMQNSSSTAKSYSHALAHSWIAASSHLFRKFNAKISSKLSEQQLKSLNSDWLAGFRFGFEQAFDDVGQGCARVADYQAELRRRFEETKAQVVAKDAEMAEVELENVNCVTSQRVLRVAIFCKFIQDIKEPIKAILTN